MSPKHTPGPWKVYRTTDGNQIIGIGDAEAQGVTDPRFGLWCDGEEREANARLIAAAPDLLDACNGLLGLVQMLSGRDDIPAEVKAVLAINHRVVDAQAIVAKVEGRAA